MVVYGFEFTQTELILLSAFAVFFAYQLYFYFHYLRAVLRLKKQTAKNRINFEVQKFPVSVIICAKDELDNLREYLPYVLNQDYPEYEVIVVNDEIGRAHV
jgi:cellulose synthase/poly-beta-1,6-N-acetylglucosamine synthase-like glycosyltransferase